jgi:hypothetical protein
MPAGGGALAVPAEPPSLLSDYGWHPIAWAKGYLAPLMLKSAYRLVYLTVSIVAVGLLLSVFGHFNGWKWGPAQLVATAVLLVGSVLSFEIAYARWQQNRWSRRARPSSFSELKKLLRDLQREQKLYELSLIEIRRGKDLSARPEVAYDEVIRLLDLHRATWAVVSVLQQRSESLAEDLELLANASEEQLKRTTIKHTEDSYFSLVTLDRIRSSLESAKTESEKVSKLLPAVQEMHQDFKQVAKLLEKGVKSATADRAPVLE